MSQVTLNLILDKISSRDKDFRYMATSDLSQELAKPSFTFESPHLENQISTAVLGQLDDQSSDISSLANKCLGLLARKVSQERLTVMASTLATKVISGKKPQERDTATLALRTLVAEMPSRCAPAVAAAAGPTLLQGLAVMDAPDVPSNSMDVLVDIINRHGAVLPDPEGFKIALLKELEQGRAGIRKRAIHCLATLACALSDESLNDLATEVIARLQGAASNGAAARTYVQTIGTMARSVGGRLGVHIDNALPMVVATLDGAGEDDDELMELCLVAMESFVQRCPAASRPHADTFASAVLRYSKYDPNYAASDDDEEAMDEENDAATCDEYEEEEEAYSDDEDSSWKVRRVAAKLAMALVAHYQDILKELYSKFNQLLLVRLKEREEAVRPDVYGAYTDLVMAMGGASRRGDQEASEALKRDVPAALRALSRQLKSRSVKTKALALKALQELARAAPGSVAEGLATVIAGVKLALEDSTAGASSLKLEALHFLNIVLSFANPRDMQLHAPTLTPLIVSLASDRYYIVSAEALRACERFAYVLRPDCSLPVGAELAGLSTQLAEAATERLRASEIAQEVKEAAISCSASVIARLGDAINGSASQVGSLAEDFAAMPGGGRARKRVRRSSGNAAPGSASICSGAALEVLTLITDRLRNETSRLAAVRAMATIARSPLPLELTDSFPPATTELIPFLRKANRQLRLSTLDALLAIIARDGPRLDPEMLTNIVSEVSSLVNVSDVAVAAAALRLADKIVHEQVCVADATCATVLPSMMELLKSPLMQVQVLNAMQSLLATVVRTGAAEATPDALLGMLRGAAIAEDAGSGTPTAAAQCAASLCRAVGQRQVESTVAALLQVLASAGTSDAERRFALLTLGELGRESDLTAFPQLPEALTAALASESVAEAASLALGGVAAGNLAAFLPLVLQHVRAQAASPKQQYQLLRALNEVITTVARKTASKQQSPMSVEQVREVLDILLGGAESERDEECRAVVAECLGHLALLAPQQVLPALQTRLTSSTATEARCVAVTALKHAAIERSHVVDAPLAQMLPEVLLGQMSDADVSIRRAAVQLLSAVARNKPGLMANSLPQALPVLLTTTHPDPSLVRVVNLGPFKHKVDDGLELRKAAYECLGVLMSRCYAAVNTNDVLNAVKQGLADDYDVKMRCHGLLIALVALAPGAVTASLDQIVPTLTATLNAKLKSDAVKQEVDRNEDLLRSCLRAVAALERLPGASNDASFKTFLNNTVKVGAMKERYAGVEAERLTAEAGSVKGAMGVRAGGPEAMELS